jgi:hypothetical protein
MWTPAEAEGSWPSGVNVNHSFGAQKTLIQNKKKEKEKKKEQKGKEQKEIQSQSQGSSLTSQDINQARQDNIWSKTTLKRK